MGCEIGRMKEAGFDVQRPRIAAGFQDCLRFTATATFVCQSQDTFAQLVIIGTRRQQIGDPACEGLFGRRRVDIIGEQQYRRMIEPGIAAHGRGNREGDIALAGCVQHDGVKGALVQVVEGGIGRKGRNNIGTDRRQRVLQGHEARRSVADIEHAGRLVLTFHQTGFLAVERADLGSATGNDFHCVEAEQGAYPGRDLDRRRGLADPCVDLAGRAKIVGTHDEQGPFAGREAVKSLYAIFDIAVTFGEDDANRPVVMATGRRAVRADETGLQ